MIKTKDYRHMLIGSVRMHTETSILGHKHVHRGGSSTVLGQIAKRACI
jgi:hypothetical protein